MENYSFDEIRPFYNSELKDSFEKLTSDPAFLRLAEKIIPSVPLPLLIEQLKQVKTATEFQQKFIFPILKSLEEKYSEGITVSGFENIPESKACLFVSNHRDIILDSAFLNYILLKHGYDTTEIAIGDNLLIEDWIRTLVRINKSFIIQRNAPIRQMITILGRQSAYIRDAITNRNQSIWIAQREGRAKDSNDRTQESLLKMFAFSGIGSFLENIEELNICPVSISYEYDACDYLKAKEFQQKKNYPDFKKSQQDDFINMKQGLSGYKGHIHYHFCGCINEAIARIEGNKNEQIAASAKVIDRFIHANYRIYQNNMVAYDLLSGKNKYVNKYSEEEKNAFETYLKERLGKIDLENKEDGFLRNKLLEMYANPLINKEEADSNPL